MQPIIKSVGYDDAIDLVAQLDADLAVRYGSDDNPVQAHAGEFEPPDGRFFVACVAGTAVACAGIRRLTAATAELKRMYVRPEQRGLGLARALLAVCERTAAELGYEELWLETGDAQPEAVALYLSEGYDAVPSFGQYADSPLSVTLGKRLEMSGDSSPDSSADSSPDTANETLPSGPGCDQEREGVQ